MSGPLPAALLPLTIPASWTYGGVVALRNRRFDRAEAVGRVNVPVVSVGNISAGGAGKTPFVRWLASRLLDHGRRPVIAMRGYGAGPDGAGDEALESEEKLDGVDVVADPDRAKVLHAYLATHPEVDCAVLDDGFQHRRLHRDLDLVLIDASRETVGDRLLPAGYLREPARSLRRADAVVVTRAGGVDERLADAIRRHHDAAPLAWSRHHWPALRVHGGDAESSVATGVETGAERPPEWLDGRRVLAMFGVAGPESILAQLRGCGAEVAVVVAARDHERYAAAKLARVRRAVTGLDAMVVTGKDWVKLRQLIDLSDWPVPIVVPDLALDVFDGETALVTRVLDAIEPGR